jgi:hypothetical protein
MYNISHENVRVIELVGIFRDINPRLKVKIRQAAQPDRRDYRVNTARMMESGFRPLIGIRKGAEQIIDAIATGAIPDPASVFYRNASALVVSFLLRDVQFSPA